MLSAGGLQLTCCCHTPLFTSAARLRSCPGPHSPQYNKGGLIGVGGGGFQCPPHLHLKIERVCLFDIAEVYFNSYYNKTVLALLFTPYTPV